MQKPSVGRIVLVPTDALDEQNNGAKVAPAIVTRVWSDEMVNVQIFLDSGPVVTRTSVKLYDTAEAAAVTAKGGDRQFAELRCYWPPRA